VRIFWQALEHVAEGLEPPQATAPMQIANQKAVSFIGNLRVKAAGWQNPGCPSCNRLTEPRATWPRLHREQSDRLRLRARGWAILKTDSKAEAIRIAIEFMELHRKHWPGFEAESEVRPMFDPGMGP